ncbi:MAG: trigger factor [Firmicutes bacterium]|nr:trigger factor [Bacillota bacterium]
MRANVERLDKTLVSIEVGFAPEEVEEALGEAYQRVVRRVKVPGFRKGKVPRTILEARYGKGVLYEEAVDILVPKAYSEALRAHNLEPIDEPEMSVVEPLEQGKPFVFKATVQVLPEVRLGEYKGLRIARPVPEVEEEEVQRRLERLRDYYAELVPADREELARGDFAVVDLEGYVDGRPFPGGSAKGYTLEIEGEGPFPGLIEGMLGMRAGETRTIPVRLPDDYHPEELAGKEAEFRVALQAIKRKELPALDDDFAKSLGYASFAELEESIRTELRSAAERVAERMFTERLLAKVVENAEIEEVPAILVERALERHYARLVRNLEYRGLSLERYLAHLGKTEDGFREELRPVAEGEVRQELVLEAVRRAEGIEPTEEEVAKRVAEWAEIAGAKDVERFRTEIERDGRLEALKNTLAREKTVKFLVEKAEALPEPEPEKG